MLDALRRFAFEIDRTAPPTNTPRWDEVREEAFDAESLDPVSPAHFLYPSRFVPLFEPAIDYARESFTPGRAVLEAATACMTNSARRTSSSSRRTAPAS